MRFDKGSKGSPPPYLNRKDQVRLFKIVGALTLVLIGAQLAADPDMWRWMFPKETAAQSDEAKPKEIDFSVRFDEDEPLPPGAFRSRPSDEDSADPADPAVIGSPKTIAQADVADGDAAEANAAEADAAEAEKAAEAPPAEVAVAIDPAVFEGVQDNYVGLRHYERDAFYHVLAKAGRVSPKALREAAGGHVPFSTLMIDPQEHRGRPVHIEGTLRRLERKEAGSNDSGVSEYWEGWMFTEESGNNPYRLVIAAVPGEFPQQGQTIEVPVTFTGYFFKLQGYPSNGGFHKAPVLIGSTIRPLPVREAVVDDLGLVPYVIGFAVAIAATLGLTLWRFARSDREFNDRHVRLFTDASPENVAALQSIEAVDPDDVLRQLATKEE